MSADGDLARDVSATAKSAHNCSNVAPVDVLLRIIDIALQAGTESSLANAIDCMKTS